MFTLATLTFICHECQKLGAIKVRPATRPVTTTLPGETKDRIFAALVRDFPVVGGVRLNIERCPHTFILETFE